MCMSRFYNVMWKMLHWFLIVCLLVNVCGKPSDEITELEDARDTGIQRIIYADLEREELEDARDAGLQRIIYSDSSERREGQCGKTRCKGEEYLCIDERCYCAPGYAPNYFQVRCVKCPVLGEKCFGHGQCCNHYGNETLYCWQGKCQFCHDPQGNWVCRDNMKDILLISSAQVAMGAALVFGIIATFILIYKLCATQNIRPLGERSNIGGRLSVGSLQLYIEERLRDAPPRYTRALPPGSINNLAPAYLNNGFVHDSSTIPPPLYSEELKEGERNTAALHI